jgi:Uma2 family endonuclease
VWADFSREELFSHNQVKNEFNATIGAILKAAKFGRYFPDGALLTSSTVGFTCQPDGAFASREGVTLGRIGFPVCPLGGYLEIEGSPDMVLEIVSNSSVEKDNVILRDLYWHAGIAEYWLVDARGDRLSFEILRHSAKGYTAVRRQGGWVKSAVFGKSFRLTRQIDDQNNPEYTLSVR